MTLSVDTLFPLASFAIIAGEASYPFALIKPIQIMLSIMFLYPVYIYCKRKELSISSYSSATILAAFLASSYWESLSLIAYLGLTTHLILFSALTLASLLIITNSGSLRLALLHLMKTRQLQ